MLLGAWWVLPAALQRWSSELLNRLLLFIPEQSGHASFSASPSHPDADAGADVAAGYTQMWHHPCTCCAAGDGCAASRAASSLSLQVLGWTFSWQVGRALLLSAPSYLSAYLCWKHFTWANKNSTLIAFLSHRNGSCGAKSFYTQQGSGWQSSVPGSFFGLLTLILRHLSKIKMWQQSYCFPLKQSLKMEERGGWHLELTHLLLMMPLND